jgi:hypothetical protein
MVGAANEGANDDVASDADDSANEAYDAADDADDAADEDVVVCLAPGSVAYADDLDDNCWNYFGGARVWYATAQNTLLVVHALLPPFYLSPTAQNIRIPRGPAPVSCSSRDIFYQNWTSLWSGASA